MKRTLYQILGVEKDAPASPGAGARPRSTTSPAAIGVAGQRLARERR